MDGADRFMYFALVLVAILLLIGFLVPLVV